MAEAAHALVRLTVHAIAIPEKVSSADTHAYELEENNPRGSARSERCSLSHS